ncbi:rare lipoprotein A [Bradyrhizobium sp. YR681]|uniref:septal ring lytic transglycosylase RlpA family protein n=1 Tax=Bradyrhizobium sp. YR681 TaxID=1144344 RepID=UPI00027114A3|nr:septal ring lytic transglycosylase RlpA family protein [Bradyrhizobium sp. YR681]EJN11871.1 rare lipoprotein A [Bradyrhizobium sp. YR681]
MKLEPKLLYEMHGFELGLQKVLVAAAIVLALLAFVVAIVEARRRPPATELALLGGIAMVAAIVAAVLVLSASAGHSCGRRFSGVASYYSNGESGSRTASGARFNDALPTAAHRCLPFGTRLRVTRAGRSVIVTINDRGPAAWTGRVLDLARAPAASLGMLGAGIARIEAEVID